MEKQSTSSNTLADAIDSLPDTECRYVIADCVVELKDGRIVSKTVLINWVPQSTKLKERMVFTSNKQSLKSILHNIQVEITADSKLDLTDEEIKEKVKKSL